MDRIIKFLWGLGLIFGITWLVFVWMPYEEFGQLQAVVDEETGDLTPPVLSSLANRGRGVYAAQGCVSCHSQQINTMGGDLMRGWGVRQSVPRDYYSASPVFWGTTRIGPDLSNIGSRQPNATWHYQHLYNPRSLNPTSIMPPFRYLFNKRKIIGEPSLNAVTLFGNDKPEEGYEVVPSPDAQALVAYLLSLNQTYGLPEAPVKEEQAIAQKK